MCAQDTFPPHIILPLVLFFRYFLLAASLRRSRFLFCLFLLPPSWSVIFGRGRGKRGCRINLSETSLSERSPPFFPFVGLVSPSGFGESHCSGTGEGFFPK